MDQQLDTAIRDGPLIDTDLHLAPPEVIDFNVVDAVFYPGERRDRDALHDDLVLAAGRDSLGVRLIIRKRRDC